MAPILLFCKARMRSIAELFCGAPEYALDGALEPEELDELLPAAAAGAGGVGVAVVDNFPFNRTFMEPCPCGAGGGAGAGGGPDETIVPGCLPEISIWDGGIGADGGG